MAKLMKKVAILTSGGDAPGMNNAVAQIIKKAIANNILPYIVRDGYEGLTQGWIEETNEDFARKIVNHGGTAIGTTRYPEFAKEEVRQRAINNLKQLEINSLIVIGGDGSYQGANLLAVMGLNCIGLPGTIDNDIVSSDFTIGFDTALNTVIEAIDRVRDTNESHNRCGIIEVMGRYCGDIAMLAGIGSGVEIISTSENKLTEEEIIQQTKKCYEKKYRSVIILVTEKLYDVHQLAKEVEKGSGYVTRATVLGHIQRGGIPTAMDRYLGTILGIEAIKQLIAGNTGICIGLSGNGLQSYSFAKALAMKRK
ncbi:6-phosphofructokinase [Spiroplasma endosymbiont of Asaphidion curtum]|uniref:6-phosphofructokinase n=1 Tax=Spiroplasma endosymbiont of Asaphidion curtum TaxID=3066281 RepID=UPI00313BD245